MHSLTGLIEVAGNIHWQTYDVKQIEPEEGFSVGFSLNGAWSRRDALRRVADVLQKNDVKWLWPKGDRWFLNGDGVSSFRPDYLKELTWLQGTILIEPEVDAPQHAVVLDADRTGYLTTVRFTIYRDEAFLQRQQRIFLSHKSANKPLARQYSDVLRLLGFDPWLDEEAMPAGTELNRGILQGFNDSCAAVFLITPAFMDEKYLRTEINYAVDQK